MTMQTKQKDSDQQETPDTKRQHQAANVNTACPSCGVYPGQYHHPNCLQEGFNNEN